MSSFCGVGVVGVGVGVGVGVVAIDVGGVGVLVHDVCVRVGIILANLKEDESIEAFLNYEDLATPLVNEGFHFKLVTNTKCTNEMVRHWWECKIRTNVHIHTN